MMKLWYAPASPFARKVRVAALELGLADRIELVETAVSPANPNATLARENPLIKVPTLRTDEGMVLYDSRVICEYLDALAGGNRLFPGAGPERFRALTRQALGDGLMDAGILRRYELAMRPEALRWDAWLAGQQVKVDHALAAAEADCASWGEAFDVGHVTVACALGWLDFRFPDAGWRARCPALAGWFVRIGERASMVMTRPAA